MSSDKTPSSFSLLSTLVAEKTAEDARNKPTPVAQDPRLDRTVKIVTHNIKTATSALIRTQVGDPREHQERMDELLVYWDNVVDLVAAKILKMFPTKVEISPGERGEIRNETRRIAFDGAAKGLPPEAVVDDIFGLDWMSNEMSEFTQQRLPDDTELVVLSTAAGLNRIEGAIERTVMQQNHDDTTLEVVFGVGNRPRSVSQEIYLMCRNEAKKVADYVVRELGGNEVVKTSPVLSSFTTMHINHVIDYLERASSKFYSYVTDVVWPDSMKKTEMIERGALVMWIEERGRFFTEMQINVLDANVEIMDPEGYYATPKNYSKKISQFDDVINRLPTERTQSTPTLQEDERVDQEIASRVSEPISPVEFDRDKADDTFQTLLDDINADNGAKPMPG